jgi:hypothetical protein
MMSWKSVFDNCLKGDRLRICRLFLQMGKMPTSQMLLISAFVFAGAGCAPEESIVPSLKETSLSPSSAVLHLSNFRQAVRVPFKVSGKGIGTDAEAGPPCDEGFFPTGNVAHGTGTHLGKFTSIHRQCVNFETLEFRDGTVTYHAANGDQLHATFEGFLSPTDESGVLSFDNPAYAAGGTGRFEGAEGQFRARGLVNLNDNTFELNVDGYLLLPK